MSPASYLKSFFEKGRIVINEKNQANNRKLFNTVLKQLNVDHSKFMQECSKENILKIDHKNLTIELVL